MTHLPEFSTVNTGDPQEEEHRRAMTLLAQQKGATARDHFEPGHFTASAFVLSADGGSLAMIEHSKLHRWLQPGGHVEPTDWDLEAAARREVAEETGLTELELLSPAPFDLDVHPIPPRKAEPAHQHFDVRYLFRASTDSLVADTDALDAKWVPLNTIFNMKSDESVWRAVRKIQRLYPTPA